MITNGFSIIPINYDMILYYCHLCDSHLVRSHSLYWRTLPENSLVGIKKNLSRSYASCMAIADHSDHYYNYNNIILVCCFAKWTREIVVRVFLWYYVIIELFVKGGRAGGRRARATRPWRPADVSALPRRYAAYGPPLDASAHGRKVLHASRPTRTLAGGI